MNSGPAGAAVAVGKNLEQLPESVQAMKSGEIGFAHLTVMARTANAVPARVQEGRLLEKARESSPGKVFHTCRHFRHAADPEGFAAEQADQVENRSLSLSMCEEGYYLLSGVLDSIGGAALRTALEPLARATGEDDMRKPDRRLADALVELAEGSMQVPQIQVTSSVETLLGLVGAPAGEMEFSLPISAKTVERFACDCGVTRVLLGSESTVIDVGRAKRTVSGPARRALNARDGHCRWPGCDRHAKRSAAHHLNLLCQAASQNRSPRACRRSCQRRRKTSSESRRLSDRSASRRVFPRASRLATYVLPRPSSRAWMMAMRERAALSWRFP